MTAEIISILAVFAPEFRRPTWNNIQILFMGAVLCRGARRVTSILRVMGLANEKNYSKYHRVLSHARWDGLVLSKILLGLLIALLPASWPILIAADETLERRKAGRRHKTSIDWTRQRVKLVSRWLRGPWILIGDGAYACMKLAQDCVKHKVTLISRLRLDAQLFESPEVKPKRRGRPPVKGKRIDLKAMVDDLTQPCQSDNAIQRCTPLLMAMYSILTLIAIKINESKTIVVHETTSWYDKNGELIFVDIIVAIRRSIGIKQHFSKSANNDDFVKFTAQEISHLISQLSLAA